MASLLSFLREASEPLDSLHVDFCAMAYKDRECIKMLGKITIGIKRRPDQLVALTSHRLVPLETPRNGAPSIIDEYIEEATPLDEASDLSKDFLRDLRAKWALLSRVTIFDNAVENAVRDILALTIPDDMRLGLGP